MTTTLGSAISLKNINKEFYYPEQKEKQVIFENLNFTFAAGKFYSIMGPSGGGKSTLLNIVSGLESADAGDVEIGENHFSQLSQIQKDTFRLENIAFVFQFFHLLPTLSVFENIVLQASQKFQCAPHKLSDEVMHWAGKLELTAHLKKYPHQLSGGLLQRTAIARAVLAKPKILLADEPTGNLDVHLGNSVLEILVEVQREIGSTMLLVTHDIHIARFATEHLILRDGMLHATSF